MDIQSTPMIPILQGKFIENTATCSSRSVYVIHSASSLAQVSTNQFIVQLLAKTQLVTIFSKLSDANSAWSKYTMLYILARLQQNDPRAEVHFFWAPKGTINGHLIHTPP